MSFSIQKIDHVQLAMPRGEEEIARKFYEQILGFQEVEKPELLKKRGGVWFALGTVKLHLGVEEPFTPAQKAHPAFTVENIESMKQHLNNQGVEYLTDDNLPGANRIHVHDVFGNRLEFLEWES
ncbi:Glyoxalase-like domain protein [Bacillus sp. THAF10]|uniref:VOC family protein n=1 Tax=Bacillus sp. THAF10 TaxID=2587848 RepID=UPI0012686946|nr:VOC family protein [Bacillus sp. THAF10]QFT87568.1 Glyoxalase-like domain protein [Bacillus sp. THAF10]